MNHNVSASRRAVAFTLIELLIVVAIIAILAAIAVPNFLEAQTRAKISRARADHRAIATGMEAYYVDNNIYIYGNSSSRAFNITTNSSAWSLTLERLSTPIAYLSSKASFRDPFKSKGTYSGNNLESYTRIESYARYEENAWFDYYWYSPRSHNSGAAAAIWSHPHNKPLWYALESAGPDGAHHNLGGTLNNMKTDNEAARRVANMAIYNATNGTVSRGSIFRVGGIPGGPGVPFYRAVENSAN